MNIGVLVGIALFGGVIAAAIASNKGLSPGAYFVVGFLVPIVGIIVALVASPDRGAQLTPAPGEGWWPDPTGRFDRRYFDGRTWTRHVTRDADGRQLEDVL